MSATPCTLLRRWDSTIFYDSLQNEKYTPSSLLYSDFPVINSTRYRFHKYTTANDANEVNKETNRVPTVPTTNMTSYVFLIEVTILVIVLVSIHENAVADAIGMKVLVVLFEPLIGTERKVSNSVFPSEEMNDRFLIPLLFFHCYKTITHSNHSTSRSFISFFIEASQSRKG